MTTNIPTVLAVDQGGTKIVVAEVDRQGNLHQQMKFASDVSTQALATKQITHAIEDYLSHPHYGEIQQISVSTVGRINVNSGYWYEIDPGRCEPIDLAGAITEQFGIPAIAANDVYSATYAENKVGIGRQTSNFIYLNLGTGIAGRIVEHNHILTGAHFDAGEVGHMSVDIHSTDKCVCGRYGCVEPIASGLGISTRARALIEKGAETELRVETNGRVGAEQLFKAYDNGDQVAIQVMDEALIALAVLIENLIRTSDPDAVVIGGGTSNGNWLIDRICARITPETTRLMKVGIVKSQINPNNISIVGAGLRGFEKEASVDVNSRGIAGNQ
ncbi:ROK family protein [Lacticaseibacillus pantheris]|uniref:ROK family protein n=1 Tax=Lacticaseibacillus pantheris TaxID=171523 RepID=UPI0026593F13|nr:ROK family protein [Lacticaseibacillus pantheris]WKF85896.1 ROK family protein [Lacticaseibacillus pantheris]